MCASVSLRKKKTANRSEKVEINAVSTNILFTREYYHATYLWTALELAPYIVSGGSTAIIAARDQLAQMFLRWFALARLPIPERMSVLSFDNEFLAGSLALSSVDFGFEELGYQAFHSLLGDVPTRRSRSGEIAARPYVVDRGSVGEPWKRQDAR